MDSTSTLYGEIAEIVRYETRYLRHYWGEVLRIDDKKRKGRVLISVPELGWNTQATGAWCQPRDRHSMVVPEVGERVEIYFMSGDRDRPVYLGTAHEIGDQTPASYTGPTVAVLYESPDGKRKITVNKKTGAITIEGDGNATVKGTNTTIEGSLFVTLKTGDAATWLANILPVDPLTGLPHGGPTAGIVKLKGA